MTEQHIHDLAVAYAQAKLLKIQQDNPDESGYDSELRSFFKSYHHAIHQIPIENEDLDEHF